MRGPDDARLPDMPTLETERLILRKLTMDDAEDVFAYASDPEMTHFVPWEAHQSIEDSREFLRRTIAAYDEGTPATWALVLRVSGRVIGGISLRIINEWRAELGYVVGREHWGQGLMTEAAARVIRCGFDDYRLYRIEALCDVDHIGSARVMEKCGMQFEGILRGRAVLSGEVRDMRIHAILRSDWERMGDARQT